MIAGTHPLQFLHGLVPLPFTSIRERPHEGLDEVFVALVAVFGQKYDLIGSASEPGHWKDLELLVLLPQPRVELPGTVKTQVIALHDVRYDDFAIKSVEVDEAADVRL
jgi:hypothetical protein